MSRRIKRLTRCFRYGEKGFTLIELLVVVAILGVLAAVAVPQVASFIGEGQNEAYNTELHDVQTAVLALMVASQTGELDQGAAAAAGYACQDEDDMDLITATDPNDNVLLLSTYMLGLDENGVVRTGCTYDITIQGVVAQNQP